MTALKIVFCLFFPKKYVVYIGLLACVIDLLVYDKYYIMSSHFTHVYTRMTCEFSKVVTVIFEVWPIVEAMNNKRMLNLIEIFSIYGFNYWAINY